jgi:hypothetical protein
MKNARINPWYVLLAMLFVLALIVAACGPAEGNTNLPGAPKQEAFSTTRVYEVTIEGKVETLTKYSTCGADAISGNTPSLVVTCREPGSISQDYVVLATSLKKIHD